VAPRWVHTTTPAPPSPAIPDRRHGDVTAPAPEVRWVGDITTLRRWDGWGYVATVRAVVSRRVIGFAVAAPMRTALVGEAVPMAAAPRGGDIAGVLFHADRGSQ